MDLLELIMFLKEKFHKKLFLALKEEDGVEQLI
jgi:acyl carrier protein